MINKLILLVLSAFVMASCSSAPKNLCRGPASSMGICAKNLLATDKVFFESKHGAVSQLVKSDKYAGGSNGGQWYSDNYGNNWFLKKDAKYIESQTSAEVISSKIYEHFGYITPETHIVNIGGVRYSAAKEIKGVNSSNFSENTKENRKLRVIAAYLKDWDRILNGFSLSDLSLIHI